MTSHDPDFWAKASDLCGLYLDPPKNAVVWSVDEKSGMQAKSRINPTKPALPGTRARREFEYQRNGTVSSSPRSTPTRAPWQAGSPTPPARTTSSPSSEGDLVAQTPEHLDLHCIADDLSAHKTQRVADFLEENPRVHIHHTPTHASWLNQVELFFSILERRLLRRGEFASTDELAQRVIAFINDYNKRATPFRRTYDGRPLRVA